MDLRNNYSKCLRLLICIFMVSKNIGKHVHKDTTEKEECNLMVDIVFMIDGHSSITNSNVAKQKSFVKYIIDHHNAPPGTVQVGFVVCSDENVYEIDFQSSSHDIIRSLQDLHQPSLFSGSNNTLHCINSVAQLFNESKTAREQSTQVAMLIVGDGRDWKTEELLQKVTDLKQSGVSVIVISIGNKSFEQLHALESTATMDKFLVLKSYDELNPLSEHFSKRTCLPLSLDLDLTQATRILVPSTTTTTESSVQSKCFVIENSIEYDFKVKLPFFGWVNKKCLPGTRFDISRCECIIDSNVRIENRTNDSMV